MQTGTAAGVHSQFAFFFLSRTLLFSFGGAQHMISGGIHFHQMQRLDWSGGCTDALWFVECLINYCDMLNTRPTSLSMFT